MSALFALLAGGPRVDMPAAVSRTRIVGSPATATATVNFNRDGTITNDAGGAIGDWVYPKHSTVGDQYEVKYDFGSGDALETGAAASGTYSTMSATRAFTNTKSAGVRQTVLTWSIRRVGVTTVLDTATGTIRAESS